MIPDKYLYISPRQASQTLITHILEAMEKEPERSFTIALSGGTTPAVLFEGSVSLRHTRRGRAFIFTGWTSVVCRLPMHKATSVLPTAFCSAR